MRPANDARSAAGDAANAHSIRRFLRSLVSAAAILVISASTATAVPAFKILKHFPGAGGDPETALLEIQDAGISHFYGTAKEEGGYGTVFRLSPNADGGFTKTILHQFNGLDGAEPMSRLVVGTDGDLYGTTWVGGQYDNGTVFRVSKTGSSFSSLFSFTGGAGGQVPGNLLLAPDGYFYATTSGGASGTGTIFRIRPNGSDFETLHTFSGPDGKWPQGGALVLIDGMLYGNTASGSGSATSGTIFRVSTDGTGFETIHEFVSGTEGSNPSAGLILGSSGELYGTAPVSGPLNSGTAFKVGTDGSGFTVLHVFAGSDGLAPYGELMQASNGDFYGTTESGGTSSLGTVFKISGSGSDFGVVHAFDGSDGSNPDAAVIQGADGRLYGTTEWGDTCAVGTVFGIGIDGTAFTPVHAFAGPDGAEAQGDLTQGPDGTLYGTTAAGGSADCGSVFAVKPDGSGFETIQTFLGSNGCHPADGLVRAPDGSLFGTARNGGSGYGTVFRLYEVGESWSLDTLHSFDGTDGEEPRNLTLGADGDLYGTTAVGGESDAGTVFRISTSGSFTRLHSFAAPGGYYPMGALAEGAAGWFYGVTNSGGPVNAGTIFKIYKDGTGFETLHAFTGADGADPTAGLTRDGSGNLYGTTSGGDTSGYGTVFMLASDESTFTTLHEFSGGPGDGDYPSATLTLVDGSLYGTTYAGGWFDFGIVFRIQLGTPAPSVAASAGGPTTFCGGESVELTATPSGGTGSYVAYQWYRDLAIVGGATSSTYTASEPGLYSATVTDSDGNLSPKSESVEVTVNWPPDATISPSGTHRLCAGSSLTLTASAGSSWLWSTGATTQSIDVDTPGDYTVTVTGENGCSATSDPTTVVSQTAPTATVSGGGIVCARGSSTVQVALTGTAPWTIRWSDGVTDTGITATLIVRTVSPRSTTEYTVTSVSDAYCDAEGTGSATVTIADPPKAVLKGSATICPGSSTDLTVELTGTPPWTLTWSDGAFVESGLTDPHHVRTVSPGESTVYSITEVSDAGCSPGTARGSARIKLAAPDASITTRSTVCASSTRNTASVSTAGKGATYSWSITNGSITSGQGTRSIQFTPGASGYVDLQVTVTSGDGCETIGPTTSVLIDTGC